MFVIATKYNGKDHIVNCVRSIRAANNPDLIVVVDSDSKDKSYFAKLSPYHVVIEDVANHHYTDGALWHCYRKYPDEDFFFSIHDSMVVHENLGFLKEKDFTAFCWFDIQYLGSLSMIDVLPYCIEQLQKVGYSPTAADMHSFDGIFGSIVFCKRHILDKLDQLGLSKILPSNKDESCASERLWGYFIHKLGINVRENNLMGNFAFSGKSKALEKISNVNRQ